MLLREESTFRRSRQGLVLEDILLGSSQELEDQVGRIIPQVRAQCCAERPLLEDIGLAALGRVFEVGQHVSDSQCTNSGLASCFFFGDPVSSLVLTAQNMTLERPFLTTHSVLNRPRFLLNVVVSNVCSRRL